MTLSTLSTHLTTVAIGLSSLEMTATACSKQEKPYILKKETPKQDPDCDRTYSYHGTNYSICNPYAFRTHPIYLQTMEQFEEQIDQKQIEKQQSQKTNHP